MTTKYTSTMKKAMNWTKRSAILVLTLLCSMFAQAQLNINLDELVYSDMPTSPPQLLSFTNGTTSLTLPLVTSPNQEHRIDERKLKITMDMGEIYQLGNLTWTYGLDFTIELFDGTGNSLVSYPISGLISNSEPEAYFFVDYSAFAAQAVSATCNVTAVTQTSNQLAQNAFRMQFDDITIQSYGTITPQSAQEISPVTTEIRNQSTGFGDKISLISLHWDLPDATQKFDSYDLEVLKLEPDIFQTVIIDWKRANRIEVDGGATHYHTTIAEGTGYYIWRVRGIGSMHEGGRANKKNFGKWSIGLQGVDANPLIGGSMYTYGTNVYFPVATPGAIVINDPLIDYSILDQTLLSYNSTDLPVFYYNQFNEQYNWSYNRIFTEGSRVSESMSFANGLGMVHQGQTKLFSAGEVGEVIASQSVYDFSARPSLTALPAPVNRHYLGYKEQLLTFQDATNGGAVTPYNAFQFDSDHNIYNNTPLGENDDNAIDAPFEYYSDNNNSTASGFPFGDLVADAEAFPYARTLFYNDATGRPRIMGTPGETFRLRDPLDTDNHNTEIFYHGVSQIELDRLFGSEAPLKGTTYKVTTVDPNNVAAFSVMSQNGQVLYTGMNSQVIAPNMEAVGNEGDPGMAFDVLDIIEPGIFMSGSNVSRATTALLIFGSDNSLNTAPTPAPSRYVELQYEISQGTFGDSCESICRTCDYRVEIEISYPLDLTDEYRNATLSFLLSGEELTAADCPDPTSNYYVNYFDLTYLKDNYLAYDAEMTGPLGTNVPTELDFLSYTGTVHDVLLPTGTYLFEKRVFVDNFNSATGLTFLEDAKQVLIAARENWDENNNCCGITADGLGDGIECDYEISDCALIPGTNDDEYNAFIAAVFESVVLEQTAQVTFQDGTSASYLSTLDGTTLGGTAYYDPVTGEPTTAFTDLIATLLADGHDCSQIYTCFQGVNAYLIMNIEGAADPDLDFSSQSQPAGFQEDFDYMEIVLACLTDASGVSPCASSTNIVLWNGNATYPVPTDEVWYIVWHAGQSGTLPPAIAVYPSGGQVEVVQVLDPNGSPPYPLNAPLNPIHTSTMQNTSCWHSLAPPSVLMPSSIVDPMEQAQWSAQQFCGCAGIEVIPPTGGGSGNGQGNGNGSSNDPCLTVCETKRSAFESDLAQYILDGGDIGTVSEQCIVDAMIAQCNYQCNPDFDPAVGPLYSDFLLTEQAMLYAGQVAAYRQSPLGYSDLGDPEIVRDDMIEFIQNSFNEGLIARTGALPYDAGTGNHINGMAIGQITVPSLTKMYAHYYDHFFLGADGASSGIHFGVAVNLVWDNDATLGIYGLEEINVALYCTDAAGVPTSPLTPLDRWFYNPDPSCAAYANFANFYAYDIAQIATIHFDENIGLHVSLLPEPCANPGNASAVPGDLICASGAPASTSFLVVGGPVGSTLDIEVSVDGNTAYLMGTPVAWTSTSTVLTVADDIVAAINSGGQTPGNVGFLATTDGLGMVTITLNQNLSVAPALVTWNLTGALLCSPTTPITVGCLQNDFYTEMASTCSPLVAQNTTALNCPVGYFEIPGDQMSPTQQIQSLNNFINQSVTNGLTHRQPYPMDQNDLLPDGTSGSGLVGLYPTYLASPDWLFHQEMFSFPWTYLVQGSPVTRNFTVVATVGWEDGSDPYSDNGNVFIQVDYIEKCDEGAASSWTNLAYISVDPQLDLSGVDYTDPAWLLPFFEVIVDDNTLLTDAYVNNAITAPFTCAGPYVNGMQLHVDAPLLDCLGGLTLDQIATAAKHCLAPEDCSACMRWVNPENILSQPWMTTDFQPMTCEEYVEQFIENQLNTLLDNCLQEQLVALENAYNESCKGGLVDEFALKYVLNEHHYTLFYYDRAGNLTKTVPPEGVIPVTDFAAVTAYRNDPANPSNSPVIPTHGQIGNPATSVNAGTGLDNLTTRYEYNSIKQLIETETPDGGIAKMWYNALGQVILSQDAQQAVEGTYGYVRYDALGRPVEGGELEGFNILFDDARNQRVQNAWSGAQALYFPYTDASLTTLFGTGTDDVVHTVFTKPATEIQCQGRHQRFLRNRVSKTFTDDGFVSYFSYDPHGNVEWMVSEMPEFGRKTIEYEYDLISGNVLRVIVQGGTNEQFMHKYEYDADNRITEAFTSTDGLYWDKEAGYEYYVHGPLARVELGEDQLQGCDYVYTIQGWLKSINQPELDPTLDPGQDGLATSINGDFLADEFAMELTYFDGDYARSNVALGNNASYDPSAITGLTSEYDLYNGNIAYWTNNTRQGQKASGAANLHDGPAAPNPLDLATNRYRYDKLNRLVGADFMKWDGTAFSRKADYTPGVTNASDATHNYDVRVAYDPNGNITDLTRRAWGTDNYMDDFDYEYRTVGNKARSNRLYHVNDAQTNDGLFPTDLDDQGPFSHSTIPDDWNDGSKNYLYDAEGKLLKDNASDIVNITWTASNKIESIHKKRHIGLVDEFSYILFEYGPSDQRMWKKVTEWHTDENLTAAAAIVTDGAYYLRDASGNVMAVYEKKFDVNTTYSLAEQHLYGSKRLGQRTLNQELFTFNGYLDLGVNDGFLQPSEPATQSKILLPSVGGLFQLDFTQSSNVTATAIPNGGAYNSANSALELDDLQQPIFALDCNMATNTWQFYNSTFGAVNGVPSLSGAISGVNGEPVIVKDPASDGYYAFVVTSSGGTQSVQYALYDPTTNTLGAFATVGGGLDWSNKLIDITYLNGTSRIIGSVVNSTGMALYAFEVNSAGVTAPQRIAFVPNAFGNPMSKANDLALAPDGLTLAATFHQGSAALGTTDPTFFDVILFELDVACGKVSNPQFINVGAGEAHRVEFTGGSKYAYVSTLGVTVANIKRIERATGGVEQVALYQESDAAIRRAVGCIITLSGDNTGSGIAGITQVEDQTVGFVSVGNIAPNIALSGLSTSTLNVPIVMQGMSRIVCYPELNHWIASTYAANNLSGAIRMDFDPNGTISLGNALNPSVDISASKSIAIAEDENGEYVFGFCVFEPYGFNNTTFRVLLDANGWPLNGSFGLLADKDMPAIIAKVPNNDDWWYLITAANGELYSNIVEMVPDGNASGRVLGAPYKNTPLGITYDVDRKQIALAVLNDLTSFDSPNKLYVAVNNRTNVELYHADVTETSIGTPVLFDTHYDKRQVSVGGLQFGKSRKQAWLGEMHIKPDGAQLGVAITVGDGSWSNLAHRLVRWNIDPNTGEPTTVEIPFDWNTVPRPQASTNEPAFAFQLAKTVMSWDYSPSGNFAFSLEKDITSMMQFGTHTAVVRRSELGTSITPQLITTTNSLHDGQLRRGVNEKIYINHLTNMPQQFSAPEDELMVITNLETTPIVTFIVDLNSGSLNNALPLQPFRKFSLCRTVPHVLLAQRGVGKKVYELSDHLGNVRATFADYRFGDDLSGDNLLTLDEVHTRVLSFSDYYPFGMQMPGRNGSTDSYRYGYQGSEKDGEISGEGNSYTTEYRQLDPRLGRWLSIDPKGTAWESPYVSMGNNPIFYTDPFGDTVKYDGFRDKVNVWLAKTFNKKFKKEFQENQESLDVYTYSKSNDFGSRKLVDAKACEFSCGPDNGQYMVYYNKGFTANDIDSKGIYYSIMPFRLGWSIGKLGLVIPTGIVIGVWNLIRPGKINVGWGMADRLSFHNGVNILSWGFGNYNKYNMFGMRLEKSPFGHANIDPNDGDGSGLIGIRQGVGKKRPVNFIDVLGEVHVKEYVYHFHLNFVSKNSRKRKLSKESVIDFKN